MKLKTQKPNLRAFRKLFYCSILTSVLLTSCQIGQDKDALDGVTSSQNKASSTAGNLKGKKSGQYVGKGVQVTGYEDGRERPTRPKYDIMPGGQVTPMDAPEEPNECLDPNDPCTGSGGQTSNITYTFRSSENLGAFSGNPAGDIYAIRVISGDNSSIAPSTGHIKIPTDLNEGAGGKYIYLTFTRDPLYSYENDGAHPATTYNIPITSLRVVSYTQFCEATTGYFCDTAPFASMRYIYKFNESNMTSKYYDFNDGAGGRYIYGHVGRDTNNYPIKEIGILSGNSSSITPNDPSWIKISKDLNEGAGGNYIYLCYKI